MEGQVLRLPPRSRAASHQRKILKLELKSARIKYLYYFGMLDVCLLMFLILLLLCAVISNIITGYLMACLGIMLYLRISYDCHKNADLLNEKIETTKNYSRATTYVLTHLGISIFFTITALLIIFLSNILI